MSDDTNKKAWTRIVAKAWADEDYKQRLMDDPAAVLTEEGLELPAKDISVVEDTAQRVWLVIPARPEGDLAEAEARLNAFGYIPF